MTKFALNCDLHLVPSDPDAVRDTILDTHASCVKEGAKNLICPKEPLTYTSLVATLKEKKLFSSLPLDDRANGPDPESSKKHSDIVEKKS